MLFLFVLGEQMDRAKTTASITASARFPRAVSNAASPSAGSTDSGIKSGLHGFEVRDETAVTRFLSDHDSLLAVLSEVAGEVDRVFGAATKLALELSVDPSDEPSNPMLFVRILTEMSPAHASLLLDQLDQQWWLDQRLQVRNLMNIDLEFIDAGI